LALLRFTGVGVRIIPGCVVVVFCVTVFTVRVTSSITVNVNTVATTTVVVYAVTYVVIYVVVDCVVVCGNAVWLCMLSYSFGWCCCRRCVYYLYLCWLLFM